MRGFKRDTSGNFAIYGAVAAIPLMLGVATAIDVSMAYRNSSGLQNALDSGLLAAGQYDGTLKEKKEIVGKFLQPHIERLELSGMSLAVDITGDQVDGPDDALVTIVEAWDFA